MLLCWSTRNDIRGSLRVTKHCFFVFLPAIRWCCCNQYQSSRRTLISVCRLFLPNLCKSVSEFDLVYIFYLPAHHPCVQHVKEKTRICILSENKFHVSVSSAKRIFITKRQFVFINWILYRSYLFKDIRCRCSLMYITSRFLYSILPIDRLR